ncbi:MAG: pantoate--beta-alanine ligase [Clostridia bacterium]|nr:pantoate--beta-alanine ligase [Clostridia bacterium]
MVLVKTIKEVKELVNKWKSEGQSIGLVPTMGYLHEGHKSLIERSVKENDRTIVSVFVNTIQFGPNEDLATYPRDIESDKKLCESVGADLIFNPEPDEMYGDRFCTHVDMSILTEDLCGASRPGHFRGVQTVVLKLFNIVMPNKAYFGEKDAQQLAVIKRMVEDLNVNVEIVGCPIVREADGLAKSSRNTYLSKEEREAATIINKALTIGKELIKNGERDTKTVVDKITAVINSEPMANIEYIKIVDLLTIKPVEKIEGSVLCAAAVRFGTTRLIDNFSI